MKKKMKYSENVNFRASKTEIEQLDSIVRKTGLSNRSHAIRTLINAVKMERTPEVCMFKG